MTSVQPPTATTAHQRRVERLADRALATGQVTRNHEVIVVPDVVIAEGTANGLPTPDTLRLVRPDGRSVWIYRTPAGLGGAA